MEKKDFDLEVQLETDMKLVTPSDFGFPFTPYGIQVDFMKSLFTALEDKQLGIFESPTGTGKSLSLLCGSLTWLQQREEERVKHLQRILRSVDVSELEKNVKQATDWVKAQIEMKKVKSVLAKANRELTFYQSIIKKRVNYLKRRSEIKSKIMFARKRSAVVGVGLKYGGDQDQEAGIELEDLLLNDEFAPVNCSDSELEEEEEEEEEPEFYQFKVIFASRTHSQIGQFANELKRTKFSKEVTMVSLGSRQNLCINSDVTKLKGLSLINERCLDLQKGSKGKQTSETKKSKTCSGCPYFSFTAIEELKNQILSEPMDMEDLVSAGKECNACPYYASRKAAKEAQLVLVPYNTILHSGTREGVGLKVQNSVVLLDEAHNLVESISNMYSNSITLTQIQDCSIALKSYMQRYMSRFNPKNLLKLEQVSFILEMLKDFLEKSSEEDAKVFSVQEFKIFIGIQHLDLYELVRFMKQSKLIFKLKGYSLHQEKISAKLTEEQNVQKTLVTDSKACSKGKENKRSSTVSQVLPNNQKTIKKRSHAGQGILCFLEFLKSLLTCNSDGRIILQRKSLKFLLLNTSEHFKDIIKHSRSVILAGGTMKPYDEIEDQLFLSEKHRICHFSCDHVIPEENLICLALSKGPSSVLFDFTFKNRNSPALMTELGRSLINLSKIVPGGLVCFLPSYDYEGTLFSFLKTSGLIDRIELKKKIFREPRDSNCDQILTEYSRQVRNNPGGAMLFAVIGGKLSEGINFSDDLGRCVVVVGLPFPNIMSLDIKEKTKFISERFGDSKGQRLLTNMCSKAVNQSIGRAIRHSSDYASILLMDHRFSRPDQQALLPNWISKRFQACDNFGQVIRAVAGFFAGKKANSD